MKILVAIVHHWNPNGGGRHASLRPDPGPRIQALQQQLLCLLRLANRQGVIDIGSMAVVNANKAIRHVLDIRVITDGINTVLDNIAPEFRNCFEEVVVSPRTSRHLGFEAQKFLAEHVECDYDLLVYLEDDLLIQDSYFFHKIYSFAQHVGQECLLLPHRMEISPLPGQVDRLFIDGPVPMAEQSQLIPDPPPPLAIEQPFGPVIFESPKNPHSGCFALTTVQMKAWMSDLCWQDGDCSYVSPLESAATLGLLKVFRLYKPALAFASWLEVCHWGTSFRSLVGSVITPPDFVRGETMS